MTSPQNRVNSTPQLTLFLEAFTWVDLRGGLTEDGLARLAWGITGTKSEDPGGIASTATASGGRPASHPKATRVRWSWGIGLSILGVILTLGAWLLLRSLEPHPRPRPALYAIRVQVLDPQGQPVGESTVHASAGSEPQRAPDGSWEIEVPEVKVPADGRIALWAESKDWQGNRVDLRLGNERNPQVEIRLKEPVTWIRGRVVDESDRAVAGARVSRQDGAPGEATTDAEGRFELELSVPQDKRVRLRAAHTGFEGDDFCYAGHDGCSIVLEKR
jgi:hypothetical protein